MARVIQSVQAGLLAFLFLCSLCDAHVATPLCNTSKEADAISCSNSTDCYSLSLAVVQHGVTLLKQVESQQKQNMLISTLIDRMNSMTAKVTSLEQEEKELVDVTRKLTNTTINSSKEIVQCKEQVAQLELPASSLTASVTALESELVDTAQKLTNTTEKSKKEIMECKEQVAELRLSTNSLTTRVTTLEQEKTTLARSLRNIKQSLKEYKTKVEELQLLFAKTFLFGGNGLSPSSAGMTCNTIRKYFLTGDVQSSVRWINPKMTVEGAFQVYCDFQSFGGGWTLVYSSRDDGNGDNNMQKGNRLTAHITSLDSGNANKRFAYPEFKAIDNSLASYSEVMLSGYQDYRNKTKRIKMYFNKMQESGLSFTQFIDWGIGRRISSSSSRRCSTVGSYYGIEKSSGKPIALSWEHYAFVAGAVSSGCAWSKEVWNEIDTQGGHLLAPQDWDKAEFYGRQTSAAGSCRNYGVYHIFVR
jgi:ubiquinone biosynthesis protein UbiJ